MGLRPVKAAKANFVRPFLAPSCVMASPHTRTLERALEAVGNKERLAAALQVPLAELEAYLQGEKPLPHTIFIEALDIVAGTRR